LYVSPFVYRFEEVDAGISKAGRFVSTLVCVERRVCSNREGVEGVWNTCQLSI
jgi:hypothetical protein